MATIETKVSDLSGATDKVQTCSFGLDGEHYEIDLTSDEYKELLTILTPYTAAGRRDTYTSTPRVRKSGGGAKRDPEQTRAMKDWLRANGYDVPARGRISKELEDAYNTQTPASDDVKETGKE